MSSSRKASRCSQTRDDYLINELEGRYYNDKFGSSIYSLRYFKEQQEGLPPKPVSSSVKAATSDPKLDFQELNRQRVMQKKQQRHKWPYISGQKNQQFRSPTFNTSRKRLLSDVSVGLQEAPQSTNQQFQQEFLVQSQKKARIEKLVETQKMKKDKRNQPMVKIQNKNYSQVKIGSNANITKMYVLQNVFKQQATSPKNKALSATRSDTSDPNNKASKLAVFARSSMENSDETSNQQLRRHQKEQKTQEHKSYNFQEWQQRDRQGKRGQEAEKGEDRERMRGYMQYQSEVKRREKNFLELQKQQRRESSLIEERLDAERRKSCLKKQVLQESYQYESFLDKFGVNDVYLNSDQNFCYGNRQIRSQSVHFQLENNSSESKKDLNPKQEYFSHEKARGSLQRRQMSICEYRDLQNKGKIELFKKEEGESKRIQDLVAREVSKLMGEKGGRQL